MYTNITSMYNSPRTIQAEEMFMGNPPWNHKLTCKQTKEIILLRNINGN